MSKWRPGGWEIKKTSHYPELPDYFEGYEAGADAMLEAFPELLNKALLKVRAGKRRENGNSSTHPS